MFGELLLKMTHTIQLSCTEPKGSNRGVWLSYQLTRKKKKQKHLFHIVGRMIRALTEEFHQAVLPPTRTKTAVNTAQHSSLSCSESTKTGQQAVAGMHCVK